MKSIPLYPATLQLIDSKSGKARMTIDMPPGLSWWEMWMSTGASLYALLGLYNVSNKLLASLDLSDSDSEPIYAFKRDETGRIVFSPIAPRILGNQLRIEHLKYGSPLIIDFILSFVPAFAAAMTAIVGISQLIQWLEKRQCEKRKIELETKLLELQVMEKLREIEKDNVPLMLEPTEIHPELPLLIAYTQFFAHLLRGRERVWVPVHIIGYESPVFFVQGDS